MLTQTCKEATACEHNREARASSCSRLEELLSVEQFKALADPTRLALLVDLLRGGEQASVTAAADCCSVDLSVVSRHLRLLRDAGIVEAEKRGREVHYTVRVAALASWLRATADALEACGAAEVKESAV
jgi:DNA-binding transcriptional ArsR family regulator